MVRFLFILFVVACSSAALAQSNPGWYLGKVPTPGEWNAAFSSKQDYLGYLPLNSQGGSMTGELGLAASGPASSGLNIGVGTAPGTPSNGDVWMTTSGMYYQVNGVTVGPLGTGGGGGGSTLAFQTDTLTVTAVDTLSNASYIPNGTVEQLTVDGQIYFCTGVSPACSVSGHTFTWSATNVGYHLATTDTVTALYTH
jgi:hypothetical protein